MGKLPRAVLSVAVFLILASCVYPPYECRYEGQFNVYRADLGYHFLLSPPGPDQALATLYPGIWRQWDRERTERVKAGCTIHVMRRRILIQISLIAGVAIWLIALISIGNRLYRQSAVPQARTGPST